MPRDVPSEHHSWLLQRQSILSQRQWRMLFVGLCGPALLLALGFLWWGYWYMLAYALLEIAAVAACLRHHARHAADYDRIDITPAAIVIEQRRAKRLRRQALNRYTTRLLTAPLRLASRNREVILAEFLPPLQRQRLAADIASHLHHG
jgi:uncharacterized membrane protein